MSRRHRESSSSPSLPPASDAARSRPADAPAASKADAAAAHDAPPARAPRRKRGTPRHVDAMVDVSVDATMTTEQLGDALAALDGAGTEPRRRPAKPAAGATRSRPTSAPARTSDDDGTTPSAKPAKRATGRTRETPTAPPEPVVTDTAKKSKKQKKSKQQDASIETEKKQKRPKRAASKTEAGAQPPMPAAATDVAGGTPGADAALPAVAPPVRVASSPDRPPAEPAPAATPSPRPTAAPLVSSLVARDGRPVTVVHLAAEVAPVARTGGLGEVVTSLAAYQAAAGIRACIVMPLYRQARAKLGRLEPVGEAWTTHVAYRDEWSRLWRLPAESAAEVLGGHGATGVPELYFLENAQYFDRAGIYGEQGRDYGDNHRRWAHFCAAALRAMPRIVGDGPAILHAHDWHAALSLAYLRGWYRDQPWYRDVATVLTVHNAGYQGHYGADMLGDFGLGPEMWRMDRFEWYGQVNLLKGGLAFADAATTVSANHATELRTASGGFGLHGTFLALRDRFVGIANGIDQTRWNPATDPLIPARFTPHDLAGKGVSRRALQEALGLPVRADVPIFVMTARLVTQKGLALIVDTPWLFDLDAQWIFLGAGERRFEDALRDIARRRPDRVVVDTAFSDGKEHLLMAAGDVCLMPCQYEPCGLTQMRAQRYGTLPLVRRVGGLADTVEDGVTGFMFDAFDGGAYAHAVRRAVGTFHDSRTWHRMMLAAMARDFDWGRSEERYRALYRGVLAAR